MCIRNRGGGLTSKVSESQVRKGLYLTMPINLGKNNKSNFTKVNNTFNALLQKAFVTQ